MTALKKVIDKTLTIERNDHRLMPLPDNMTGMICVINPERLNDRYRRAKFQLFLAQGGFGCKASASGSKVFGKSLADGEEGSYWRRPDFIGIVSQADADAILAADQAPETPVDLTLRDYLAVGPNVFAHGDTIKEACSKAGIKFGTKRCLGIFRVHPEAYIDDFGRVIVPTGTDCLKIE